MDTIEQQLQQICASNHWNVIKEVIKIDGKPVYLLTNSEIPNRAKTGFPHLYSVTDQGRIFELSTDQTHAVMVLYNSRQ